MSHRSKNILRSIGVMRLLILVVAMLLSAACNPRRGVPSLSIVVGSKDFPEQTVLGEILAQHIEKKMGLPVRRQFNLAGSYVCHNSLRDGSIDLYPEYTGTAWTAILNKKSSGSSSDLYQLVKAEYHHQFALEVTPPLGFSNGFVLVVRGDDAQRLNLKTISDLARHAPQWRIAMGYEFLERPDGFAGLAQTYNLQFSEPPRSMSLAALYRSLDEHQFVVVGSSTDGLIQARGFVALEDDKHYFPSYDAVPIVREQTLDQYPALRATLSELSGKINESDIRRLNYAVENEHRDPKQVVAEFLRAKSL